MNGQIQKTFVIKLQSVYFDEILYHKHKVVQKLWSGRKTVLGFKTAFTNKKLESVDFYYFPP